MQAIEFEAQLKDGVIRLPTPYQHWRDNRSVKVILLAPEDAPQTQSPDASQRLAAILEIGRRCAAGPELAPCRPDDIIGYDADGLPTSESGFHGHRYLGPGLHPAQ